MGAFGFNRFDSLDGLGSIEDYAELTSPDSTASAGFLLGTVGMAAIAASSFAARANRAAVPRTRLGGRVETYVATSDDLNPIELAAREETVFLLDLEYGMFGAAVGSRLVRAGLVSDLYQTGTSLAFRLAWGAFVESRLISPTDTWFIHPLVTLDAELTLFRSFALRASLLAVPGLAFRGAPSSPDTLTFSSLGVSFGIGLRI